MKLQEISETGEILYEHKGFTGCFTKEAVDDALTYLSINLIEHVTKMLDSIVNITPPFNFRIITSRDIHEDYSNFNVKYYGCSTIIRIIPK
jgi:hypothetical protein